VIWFVIPGKGKNIDGRPATKNPLIASRPRCPETVRANCQIGELKVDFSFQLSFFS
jgi:hypothetical protein